MAIDTTALLAAVTRNRTLKGSILEYVNGLKAGIAEAVRVALEADDAADAGSNDAAQAAINSAVADFTADQDEITNAITANTPGGPVVP